MRDWIKPELVVEKFELSQHVASGCGTKLGDANSTYPIKVYATYVHNGNNRKDTITLDFLKDNNDTDGDGKIDRSEFVAYFNNVINNLPGGYKALDHYRIDNDNTTYTDISSIFNS